jgi:hypothetical protein
MSFFYSYVRINEEIKNWAMQRIIFGEINCVHVFTYDETLMEKQYSCKRLRSTIIYSNLNFATIVFQMIVAFEEKEAHLLVKESIWKSNKKHLVMTNVGGHQFQNLTNYNITLSICDLSTRTTFLQSL